MYTETQLEHKTQIKHKMLYLTSILIVREKFRICDMLRKIIIVRSSIFIVYYCYIHICNNYTYSLYLILYTKKMYRWHQKRL